MNLGLGNQFFFYTTRLEIRISSDICGKTKIDLKNLRSARVTAEKYFLKKVFM